MDRCCEIIKHEEDGEVLAVTLRIENGQLQSSCAMGCENMLRNIMNAECEDRATGNTLTMADGEAWLAALPDKYRGSSYIEARLVE